MFGFGFESDVRSLEGCNHTTAVILFDGQIGGFAIRTVTAYVGECSGINLSEYVAVILDIDVFGEVTALEVYTTDIGFGDNPQVQHQRYQGYEHCRNKIGPHESFETHPAGQNSDNFALISHFGGEEYDGDERKETTELVDEVRDEVEVVIDCDLTQRSFGSDEVIHFLDGVEHYHYDNYEGDGEKERPQKLAGDIAVEDFEPREFYFFSVVGHSRKIGFTICA